MSYYENKCPNCGGMVVGGDTYCRTCKSPLEAPVPIEVAMLEGRRVSDWHMFIDKNSSRYVDIFSQNEGKKLFWHMNWAALFFGLYWLLYRKMYKFAAIFLAVATLISILIVTVTSVAFKSQFYEAYKIIEPYSQYMDTQENGLYVAYSDGTMDINEVFEAKSRYDKEINSLIYKFAFWVLAPVIVFRVIFGLLADCIYKAHIIKRIDYNEDGVSVLSVIVGGVLYIVFENIISAPVITFIVTKLLGNVL